MAFDGEEVGEEFADEEQKESGVNSIESQFGGFERKAAGVGDGEVNEHEAPNGVTAEHGDAKPSEGFATGPDGGVLPGDHKAFEVEFLGVPDAVFNLVDGAKEDEYHGGTEEDDGQLQGAENLQKRGHFRLMMQVFNLNRVEELQEGVFLCEDRLGIAGHFKEPSFAVEGQESSEDGLRFTGQANVGTTVIGNDAGGGQAGEVIVGDGGESGLSAPAVDIGEETTDITGEDGDGNGCGTCVTGVAEFGFANTGGCLLLPTGGVWNWSSPRRAASAMPGRMRMLAGAGAEPGSVCV